ASDCAELGGVLDVMIRVVVGDGHEKDKDVVVDKMRGVSVEDKGVNVDVVPDLFALEAKSDAGMRVRAEVWVAEQLVSAADALALVATGEGGHDTQQEQD